MTPLTDRALRRPDDLDRLRFDERGLIPVVAQQVEGAGADPRPTPSSTPDAPSSDDPSDAPGSPPSTPPSAPADGSVLMVAWANREALERALETGYMHYWSRSRSSLWKKGESSGNLQRLVSLHADCDADTVLARVRMEGPACHTDEATCFGAGAGPGAEHDTAETDGDGAPRGRAGGAGSRDASSPDTDASSPDTDAIIGELWAVLEARDRERPEGSYTTRLLADENLRMKKLGEEVTELVIALVRGDGRAPEEAADLLYHLLVALKGAGHGLDEVVAELKRRRG